MKIIDIHSHILPAVDDGASNTEVAVKLLEIMKSQGITDVVATPHFIASEHNMEEFLNRTGAAMKELSAAVYGRDLPNIYFGSEIYYFRGIGKSSGISRLSLNGSEYILLELPNSEISQSVLDDINGIYSNLGLTPIIAHIERYTKEFGFKKLLKLLDSEICYAQVNASSILYPPFRRAAKKLFKMGYVSFIATDSHSLRNRPPLMDQALKALESDFGKETKDRIIRNLDGICREITSDKTHES